MPQPKFLIAGVLIIGAISYLMFSSINSSMVYYHTVTELLEKAESLAGQGVRLSGHVAPGSIDRNDKEKRLQFLVLEKATQKTIPVTYSGIVPDTFKDAAEVVVEGKYDVQQGEFQAHVLLAKCPSKYEREEYEGGYDGQVAAPAS